MPKPILVSHQGRPVHLHEDGSMTNTDGTPLAAAKPEKLPPAKPKRWHDPYG